MKRKIFLLLFFFLALQSGLALSEEIVVSEKEKSVLLQIDGSAISAQSDSLLSQEAVTVGFIEQLSKILEDTKKTIESNFSRWANQEITETPTAFASRQRRLAKAFSEAAKVYCQLLQKLSDSSESDLTKYQQLCQEFLDFSKEISQRAAGMEAPLRQASGGKKR